MALGFDVGSVEYLSVTAAPVTAAPLTMACWARSTNITINQAVMSLGQVGVTNEYWALTFRGARAGDPVSFQAQAAAASFQAADTSTGYSANTWHHIAGVAASATDRRSFIDGGSKGTKTTSVTPLSVDTIRLANYARSTSFSLDGQIAEAAMWSVALSDAEIALLAKGFSPLLLRPESLFFYAPLLSAASPAPELILGNNLTHTGTLADTDHPRIIYPGRPL